MSVHREGIMGALRQLVAGRQRADRNVLPFQEEGARPGAFFVRLEDTLGVTIYGEVLEPQYEEDREMFGAPSMKNVRLSRCYSKLEPDGEIGNTHIATMATFLTKEQFDIARELAWPNLI
jgi:hypothetical protein